MEPIKKQKEEVKKQAPVVEAPPIVTKKAGRASQLPQFHLNEQQVQSEWHWLNDINHKQ